MKLTNYDIALLITAGSLLLAALCWLFYEIGIRRGIRQGRIDQMHYQVQRAAALERDENAVDWNYRAYRVRK